MATGGHLGEDPQMAGAGDGDPDPVLVRQRAVLRRLPDRAGAERACHRRAPRRRRWRSTRPPIGLPRLAARRRGAGREGRAADAARPAGRADHRPRGAAAALRSRQRPAALADADDARGADRRGRSCGRAARGAGDADHRATSSEYRGALPGLAGRFRGRGGALALRRRRHRRGDRAALDAVAGLRFPLGPAHHGLARRREFQHALAGDRQPARSGHDGRRHRAAAGPARLHRLAEAPPR